MKNVMAWCCHVANCSSQTIVTLLHCSMFFSLHPNIVAISTAIIHHTQTHQRHVSVECIAAVKSDQISNHTGATHGITPVPTPPRTPVSLGHLHTHHPDLFSQLQQHTAALQHIEPYNAQVVSALVTHCGPGFKVTPTMAARSHRHRVAPITWTNTTTTTSNNISTTGLGDGGGGPHGGGQGRGGGGGEERWICIGSGAIEAASHCETRWGRRWKERKVGQEGGRQMERFSEEVQRVGWGEEGGQEGADSVLWCMCHMDPC